MLMWKGIWGWIVRLWSIWGNIRVRLWGIWGSMGRRLIWMVSVGVR